MRIRSGFVSNSSSSSFVVALCNISQNQLHKIWHHDIYGEKLGIPYAREGYWNIVTGKGIVRGFTLMDNFDMGDFLEKIGVTGVILRDGYGKVDNEELEFHAIEECETCTFWYLCYTDR